MHHARYINVLILFFASVRSDKRSKSDEKCLEYVEKFGLGIDPIVEGNHAASGEFPYMAALGFGHDHQWQCGGSLISEKFVLTAAHCLVTEIESVKIVRLGSIYIDGRSDTTQDMSIGRVVLHPDYEPPSMYNDVALIELEGVVNFSLGIRPGCLYTGSDQDQVWALGWGLTSYGGSPSVRLQKVMLEIFTEEECKTVHKINARRLSKGIQYDRQICYGSRDDERDACKGDSGGPVSSIYGKEILAVITAGKNCGVPGVPAIYTRLEYYLPWIEETVWPDD